MKLTTTYKCSLNTRKESKTFHLELESGELSPQMTKKAVNFILDKNHEECNNSTTFHPELDTSVEFITESYGPIEHVQPAKQQAEETELSAKRQERTRIAREQISASNKNRDSVKQKIRDSAEQHRRNAVALDEFDRVFSAECERVYGITFDDADNTGFLQGIPGYVDTSGDDRLLTGEDAGQPETIDIQARRA